MKSYNNRSTATPKKQAPCGAKGTRMYRGYEREDIGGYPTFTAKRDLPEICHYCFEDITQGDQYTRVGKNLWHLRCKLKHDRGIKNPWGGLQV